MFFLFPLLLLKFVYAQMPWITISSTNENIFKKHSNSGYTAAKLCIGSHSQLDI